MRRLLLIARREYFAYAKTVGFWLSLLVLPAFMAIGAMIPTMMDRAAPVRTIAFVDLTGQDKAAGLKAALDGRWRREQVRALRSAALAEAGPNGGDAVRDAAEKAGPEAGQEALGRLAPGAARAYKPPKRNLLVVEPPPELAGARDPDAAGRLLSPYVAGDKTLTGGRKLDAAVVLWMQGGELKTRVWSQSVSDEGVQDAVREALEETVRRDRLIAAGVSPEAVEALEQVRPQIEVYSPKAASGGEVGFRDRLPGIMGFALGMLLWSSIVSGASILMNSVIEEKSNRVLEVLLSSASTTEILAGKVLGVAGITLTVLGAWGGLGAFLLYNAFPGIAHDLVSVLTENGLAFYLGLYLIGGYLMYAVLFAAIGAFCETPREAQTLLGPVMIVLAIPIVVMNVAIRTPDMPILKILSWVPFFTPFLMTARAPTEPPLVEIIGTLAAMAVTAWIMVWLASKAFRAGALSTAKLDWKSVLAMVGGKR
ncbi:MAG TPA: ABC transporter permease [Caulobacteraceae bacterium]|nr:ABC transporter permease [Caulobacteraceae bacterium]